MKFLVLAYDAQSWACAGSKGDGAIAMACEPDPTLEETITCVLGEIPKVRLWVKPVLWYENAMCSVACLE